MTNLGPCKGPADISTRARRTQNRFRRFGKVAIGTAIVISAVVLVAAALVFHKSANPAARTDSPQAENLEARVKRAEAKAAIGEPQVVSVDESELNSFIASRLGAIRTARNSQGSLRDIKVHLVSDRMGVHVVLNVYGQDMTIDIAGTLHSENRYLQFEPTSGRIGALPIPRSALQAAMRQAMSAPEGHENMRLPAALRDLRVEGSKLVATYE